MVPHLRVVQQTPSELVEAARCCPAMVSAHQLAEWVGPGRDLTASGVLKPAAAAEACGLLGIGLISAKPRSALDIDELMAAWHLALRAGFLEVADRRVRAGHGLGEWSSGDAQAVLRIWTAATLQAAGLAADPEAEPRLECLTVLHTLYERDGTATLHDLTAAYQESVNPGAADTRPCPGCGQSHEVGDPFSLLDFGGYDGYELVEDLVEDAALTLQEFGAATLHGDTARLTALGGMLTTIMFRDSAPPATTDVRTFVTALTALPPPVAATMARPWLDGRPLTDGVRELLAFAESASGQSRLTALALAGRAGPGAAAAWREWSGRPGFGAYARQWLAEQGEPLELWPTDDAWLTVDTLTAVLSALPAELPAELLTGLLQQELGAEAAEVLPLLHASGHPEAESVLRILGVVPGEPHRGSPTPLPIANKAKKGRRPATSAVYQLKISLRGVSKPPVWRRLLVPADIRLDELHEVIQRAMGWHGGHLHAFSQGWLEYGSPDAQLGHQDERSVRLAQLLTDPGDKLRYTYDFGDDWEHDVLLEQALSPGAGERYPCCLTGRGACPPEDCGGVWGYAELKGVLADPTHEEHQGMLEWLYLDSANEFDPKAFSVDKVNGRLEHLRNS